jgi:Domain of unknown function DUF29
MDVERKHAPRSQTRRLIVRLLKWPFQQQRRTRSWLRSMASARIEIAGILNQNRSLRPSTTQLPEQVYPQAIKLAMVETGLDRNSFAETCPYTFSQVMDDDFPPREQPGVRQIP